MTTIYLTATSLQRLDADGAFDEAQLAAAAFLARYSGRTLDAYRHDLRGFFQWSADVGLTVLAATRPLLPVRAHRRAHPVDPAAPQVAQPRQGNKPALTPLVPRAARTVDLAVGERHEGPITCRHICRHYGQRLDRRTVHRWVRSIGKRVPLRDVQIAARHADPRTTTIYDRRREKFDRHATYVVVAFVIGG
jgi:hypothetical protein